MAFGLSWLGFAERERPNPGLCPFCGHQNEPDFGEILCENCSGMIPEDPLQRGMDEVRTAGRRGDDLHDYHRFRIEAVLMVAAILLIALAIWLFL